MKTIHHCFAIALYFATTTICAAAPLPNVVLIVADDLGYGDLGCYEGQASRTPHIDGLAAGGVRFTDFHSAGAMCTPTRVSILTGRYPQNFGPVFDGPLSGDTQRHLGLPSSAVTIAELLKERGYKTACHGKWHLGFRSPFLPTDQGFDEFRGLLAGDGDHHSHIDRYGDEDWWRNDSIDMETGYTTELLTGHSIDFIRRHRDVPFFLYLPHLAIHFPWQGPGDPPHRMKGRDYKQDKWGVIPNPGNVRPHVKAMAEAIDDSTGSIMDALKRLSLVKQTVVIFTSDNGGYLNYGNRFQNISSNGRLRGQKGQLYEGGHRVPLIISWQGRFKPTTNESLAHSNDFLPTICSLVGVDMQAIQFDGIDLASVLDGHGMEDRTLFWRAGKEWAIRRGPWKCLYEQGRTELFHLGRDVEEQHDLSPKHPVRADAFTKDWERWNKAMSH